jgi:hypothetical protein
MNKLLLICFSFFLSVIVLNAQQKSFSLNKELTTPTFSKSVQPNEVLSAITHTPNDSLNYMDAGAIYTVNGNDYVVGTNTYGDLGKYQRFDLTQSYLLKGFMFYTSVSLITSTADTLSFVVRTVNTNGSPGTTLATVRRSTDLLNANGWNSFTLSSPLPVGKSIFIGYEWTAAVNDTFGLACDKEALGYGNGAHRAWEKWSDNTYHAMDAANAWGTSFDVDLWIAAIAEKVLPISSARIDANADFIPDRVLDTITVAGVVFTPNYQTNNRSYYIWDGTGGICTFIGGLTSPALNLGDSVVIRGWIQQYNGLDEINPNTDTDVWVVGTNANLPAPIIIAQGQYLATAEQNEGLLVQMHNLSKVSGTWPSAGASANIVLTNGTDTVTVRVDSDTDVDGNPEPLWPRDVIGVMTQFSSASLSAGYQIQPRYYASDFLPPVIVPVELTSLSASVSGKSVIINWATATEKNNMGFEIQRSSDKSSFAKIGFVNGNGTTTELKKYSFADNNVLNAKNYYRLKQMDYDGSYYYSTIVEAEIGTISSFSLEQNYPNPFNPSTQIKYSLLTNSNVKVTIFNALGESIKEVANEVQQSGVHIMNFNAAGLSSGVYFYSLQANAVDGSKSFMATKKMILMK